MIQIYRGDTNAFTIICKRGTNAEDLTGAKLYFTVKTNKTDPDSSALLQKDSAGNGITITQATKGKARLLLTSSDTDVLTPGTYFYDVQIRTSGNEVYTLFAGEIEVLHDITRRIT